MSKGRQESTSSKFLLHHIAHLPTFDAMKRYILLSAILVSLFTRLAPAQDAAAIAAKEEADARYKGMTARIEELENAVHDQQKTMSKLNEELRTMREELSKVASASKDSATQDSIKRLAEAIEEVDKKRLSDNKNVVTKFNEAVAEIQKLLSNRPPTKPLNSAGTPGNPPPLKGTNTSPVPEKGFNYTVQNGDTLSGLVLRLRKQGVNVTQKQLKEANPDVNWDRLKVGRDLFIPGKAQ
jgi:LysM repeat protein